MTIEKGIADHKRGDTWDGVELIFLEIGENEESTPVDLTGVSVLAQFKIGSNLHFEFKTSDNTIAVPNPTDGKINFQPRIMNVPADTYHFDVQLTHPDGRIETVLPTHSWTIVNDISR